MSESGNYADRVVDRRGVIARIPSMDRVVFEIGCGATPRIDDAITVDIADLPEVDIVADVNRGLSFLSDGSVDEIHCHHFMEHLNDLGLFMAEVHRVLKVKGVLTGTVPYFANPYFYSDYTHRTAFGLYSFSYFAKRQPFVRKVPVFYNDLDFRILEVRLVLLSPFPWRNRLKKLQERIFNMNRFTLEFYEESLAFLMPAYEIRFRLEKSG